MPRRRHLLAAAALPAVLSLVAGCPRALRETESERAFWETLALLFQSCCTIRTGGWSQVFHPRYSFHEMWCCWSSSGSVTKPRARMQGHRRTHRFGSFMAEVALLSILMMAAERRGVPGLNDQPRSVGSSQY